MNEQYTISELIKKLKISFPDITVSKIRFLESKGLIEPERSPSGYRIFSETDIEKLSDILSLQEEEHLPLKIIKEKTSNKNYSHSALHSNELTFPTYSKDELLEVSSLKEYEYEKLIEYNILKVQSELGGVFYFDDKSVNLCKIISQLFELGLDVRYIKQIFHSAENEATIFKQLLLPLKLNKNPKISKSASENYKKLVQKSQELRNVILDDEN